MDRLDELAVFVAILDAGSLALAARRLRRSAPAVTRALAALEARLGARLIERTTRRLTPTEAGRRLGADARRALAAYGDALRPSADTAPRGLLRITAPLIFGRRHVTPVVASFLAAHPAMQVELLLADRNLDLLEEGLDVALRIGPPGENLPPPHRVGEVRRVVVAAPLICWRAANRVRRRTWRGTRWCMWSAGRSRRSGGSASGGARRWCGWRRA